MNKRLIVLIGIAAGFTAGTIVNADPDASLYVGVKSCKMCHKKPEEGELFA